jgi:hypothetical protein
MDYRDWVNRLKGMAATLASRPKLFGVNYLIGDPLDDESLHDTEEEAARRAGLADFRVPAPLRDFYGATRGFNFQWVKFAPPTPFDNMTGTCNVSTVGELFAPDEDLLRFVGQDAQSAFSPYGQLRVLDNAGPASHALARFSESGGGPELFWRSADEEGRGERMSRLLIDFEQYLECALAACFLFRWQTLFVEDSSVAPAGHEREVFAKLKAVARFGLGDRDLLRETMRAAGRSKA